MINCRPNIGNSGILKRHPCKTLLQQQAVSMVKSWRQTKHFTSTHKPFGAPKPSVLGIKFLNCYKRNVMNNITFCSYLMSNTQMFCLINFKSSMRAPRETLTIENIGASDISYKIIATCGQMSTNYFSQSNSLFFYQYLQ